jgi:hypothetical protein
MKRDTIFAITAVCMVVLAPATLGVAVGQTASTTSYENDDALSAWGGTTTPFTASLFDGGFSATDDVVTHGSGVPGWYVGYDANDSDAPKNLNTWVNSSDDRRLLYHDRADGVALVVAPGEHIRSKSGWFGVDGLSTLSWVEHVEVEQRVELVDPVGLESKSSVETSKKPSRTARALAALNDGAFFTEQGVAYSGDANQTDMGDVKETIAADSSSIPASADGSGATVAVLDTGAIVGEKGTTRGVVFGNGTVSSDVRIDHGKNFVTNETIDPATGDYSAIADGDGHGTYTAARIAGAAGGNETLQSPAHNATLAVGKVLADSGSGSIHNIFAGLEWACGDVGADVVSMSLGSPRYSKTLADQIHSCLEDDGVSAIVVAAGNSRWSTGRANVGTPADVQGAISVSATNTGDGTPESVETAYFANTGPDRGVDGSSGVTRGETPDIASPGMEDTVMMISSTGYRENRTLSGTSMSTPDVAAAVALLVDERPELKGEHKQVEEIILETASPARHLGTTESEHGLLNVSRALADDRPELDQADARTKQAESRDQANHGVAGTWGTWLAKQGFDL